MKMAPNSVSDIDVIIEAIEVFINHILYIRNIYPEQIFKKMRIYNNPVYICIYPRLTTYLSNILQICRNLLTQKYLYCIELKIYSDINNTEYESYTFEIKSLMENTINDDIMFKTFEEEISISLKKITEKLNKLEKLPHNVKFKILLQTTNSAFTKITHTPEYQHFPWINTSHHNTILDTKTMNLLPLVCAKSLGLRLIVDTFS